AERKNVLLFPPHEKMVWNFLLRAADISLPELTAFARTANPREHPAIVRDIVMFLDILAASYTVKACVKPGALPMEVLRMDMLAVPPPPGPGNLGRRWPGTAELQQMVDAHLAASPGDDAALDAMSCNYAGHA